MTNQEKLTYIIQKAIDGEFDIGLPNWFVDEDCSVGSLVKFEDSEWFSDDYDIRDCNEIIFNHDFAKALWGEYDGPSKVLDPKYGELQSWTYGWEHHLKQAVINKDPINYMYSELTKDKDA